MATILTLADFQDQLKIQSYNLTLSENVSTSFDYSGAMWSVETGNRLWMLDVTVTPHSHANTRKFNALIQQIMNAGVFFEFSPPDANVPAEHSAGANIDNCQVRALSASTAPNTLYVKGLDNRYKLSTGDYLSFENGGVSKLFQLTNDFQVGTAGNANLNVLPRMFENVANRPEVDTSVKLRRPYGVFAYYPNTFSGGSMNYEHGEGVSFSAVQVVKGIN